jgi:hypothetical protein
MQRHVISHNSKQPQQDASDAQQEKSKLIHGLSPQCDCVSEQIVQVFVSVAQGFTDYTHPGRLTFD